MASETTSKIRDFLLRAATTKPFRLVTYGEMAAALDIHIRAASNKRMLDKIAREELAKGLPDITFILVRKNTRYSGQIGFKPSPTPSDDQKRMAREALQAVIDLYNPNSCNPYS